MKYEAKIRAEIETMNKEFEKSKTAPKKDFPEKNTVPGTEEITT